jgi:UDP-galactopyranose mutase
MVDHSRIKILLGIDFRELAREIDFRDLIYTGPIDEFFDYRFGPLPYRSLRFKHKNYKREFFQPVAVVNHPNRHRYTRVTEMKHLTGQQHPSTSVIYEYPTWDGDPYYPVPQSANLELYQQYRGLASEKKNVHFVGRLATYRYYNMDQIVASALTLYHSLVTPIKAGSTSKLAAAINH